jgi:hypothetical protein
VKNCNLVVLLQQPIKGAGCTKQQKNKSLTCKVRLLLKPRKEYKLSEEVLQPANTTGCNWRQKMPSLPL